MSETVYTQVTYSVSHLTNMIELGSIGLPDIQRPFVWPNTKVRDLFDSMYRGYPVGYLLFWNSGHDQTSKAIGTDTKQVTPTLLIVDGQQRLTSLYAVIKAVPVVRENYQSEHIEIAFNPLQQSFEVADAAIRRDPTFIANISTLWVDPSALFRVVDQYLATVAQSRDLSDSELQGAKEAIMRLQSLPQYALTALQLAEDVTEEQVAEVFVRINSMGKALNQSDFILTLMSVFWDEGRSDLERFCRAARQPSAGQPSPYNHYVIPQPDQLLRTAIALGFRRARLQHVYSILRGKDLDTGEFSSERRSDQFDVLKASQATTLKLTYWHDFFKCLAEAGYLGGRYVSSMNNLMYAYSLYLMGRTHYSVPEAQLRPAIARWFFMSSLTGRYTGSPESAFDFDLAGLRDVTDGAGFLSALRRVCDSTLTSDFWSISLPTELATSSPRSPSLFGYYAALVLLEATPLFSSQPIRVMLDPSVHSTKAAVERHHLFPRAYLEAIGVKGTRATNQIGNYALVEWGDNLAISDRAPADYWPILSQRVPSQKLERMHYWHALPLGWQELDYETFLERRRELMARVIADGYERLGERGHVEDLGPSIEEIIRGGEDTVVEFKAAMRINLHTGQKDDRIEHAIVKTVGAFLNTRGGTLVVGVADDGTAVGVEADHFESEDRMSLHLSNLVNARIGPHFMVYVHPRFQEYDGVRVMTIDVHRASSAAFVKDGGAERFYVRTGASTTELTASQTQEYIRLSW